MAFTRRNMLAATGAAAAMTLTRTALGGWEPNARYPDPAIQILDPAFAKYRIAQASVERLATGMRWCEGPVYFGDARCLLWSDIPNSRIMRWDEGTGRASVYRTPSNNANGNTRDRQGRLVTCEHDSRRVTRTEYDGTITVLMDRFEGKPLNSPNDIVVKSDDSIWFSDPPFGILGNYEGHVATPELPTNEWSHDFDVSSALRDAPPLPRTTPQWLRCPGVVTHVFTHFPLELTVYTTAVGAKTPAPAGMRWVALADLPGEALPNVMRKVLVHAGALSG